ncbi:hypothetical protein J4G43_014755 [Bradyrhizobium barranii subsp. barranii]|uniref:Uncharacterized protein n=1 Tax=Bradyrhizobium barranii subsp. barranii TaxID=2823807 RepID=A0A939S0Q0_9BRAD|nr:hypothetical protein [Bradyrhizobium barranii]UEM15372.1 hypothetical protein J4G43_014755 [Bradyrhizobium barranii subsp. barranii]
MTLHEYAVATFRRGAETPRAGLAIGERVAALDDLIRICPATSRELLAGKSVLELLRNWDSALEALGNLRAAVRVRHL